VPDNKLTVDINRNIIGTAGHIMRHAISERRISICSGVSDKRSGTDALEVRFDIPCSGLDVG
jgi:hypothetical protein